MSIKFVIVVLCSTFVINLVVLSGLNGLRSAIAVPNDACREKGGYFVELAVGRVCAKLEVIK